jgi:hypothetical protein
MQAKELQLVKFCAFWRYSNDFIHKILNFFDLNSQHFLKKVTPNFSQKSHFLPKLVGFWLIWAKFSHFKQNSAIFGGKFGQFPGETNYVEFLLKFCRNWRNMN